MKNILARSIVSMEASFVSTANDFWSARWLHITQWLFVVITSSNLVAGACQCAEDSPAIRWKFHSSEVARARSWAAYYTMMAATQQGKHDCLEMAKIWESYSNVQQLWADYFYRNMDFSNRAGKMQMAAAAPRINAFSANHLSQGVRSTESKDQAARPPLVLVNGVAFGLHSLPMQVHKMIEAGNFLQTKPYVWGGGHRILEDDGYDCSSAVSYILIKAGLLNRVLNTRLLADYGQPGEGRFVTLWVKSGDHAFMTICGLRLDTAGGSLAQGPRWRVNNRNYAGFSPRHPAGL